MNILPLINETFDSFLLKSQQIHKELIQKVLESMIKIKAYKAASKTFISWSKSLVTVS